MTSAVFIRIIMASASVSLVLMTGCGETSGKLGQVSGKVRLDDAPVVGAFIVFTPESGRTSTAETDAEGLYELSYTVKERGALIGKHTVSIESPPEPDVDQALLNEKRQRVSIPARYNSNTSLEADVRPGVNTIDFDLRTRNG